MTAIADRPQVDLEQELSFPLWSDDLADGLVEAHDRVVRAEAERLAWVAELMATEAYADVGYLSPIALLVDRLGISVGTAKRLIGLARALGEMPVVRAAFHDGVLDEPRVQLLAAARQANPDLFREKEEMLVDSFAGLSMKDFATAVDLWRQNTDLDAAEQDAQQLRDRRYLNVSPTLGNLVRIDGQLDPEAGQTLLTALRSITDPQQLDPTDTRTPGQRRADALTQLCADHLASGKSPISGGFRPQVTVTASYETLLGLLDGTGCETEDCGLLTPGIVRKILCDAEVTPVVLGGGFLSPRHRTVQPDHPLVDPQPPQPPRQGVRHPGMPIPTPLLRCPSRDPLAPRRTHLPREPVPALRTAPHHGPRRHHHPPRLGTGDGRPITHPGMSPDRGITVPTPMSAPTATPGSVRRSPSDRGPLRRRRRIPCPGRAGGPHPTPGPRLPGRSR